MSVVTSDRDETEPMARKVQRLEEQMQTMVRMYENDKAARDDVHEKVNSVYRHVIAQTFVGARSAVPLVISIVALVAIATTFAFTSVHAAKADERLERIERRLDRFEQVRSR